MTDMQYTLNKSSAYFGSTLKFTNFDIDGVIGYTFSSGTNTSGQFAFDDFLARVGTTYRF